MPRPVGLLVFVDLAFPGGDAVARIGCVVLLVALGNAAQHFGGSEDGVVGGRAANDFSFCAVFLVIKLQGGSFNAGDAC